MKSPYLPGPGAPATRSPYLRDLRTCAGGRPRSASLQRRVRTFGWGVPSLPASLATLAVCTCLMGCSFLKPARETTQRFVLTPLPATGSGTAAPGALPVGLGQVKIPAYLMDTSLAVRSATNRINYLPLASWAERLDRGIQRVLAANLAITLPTDQVRLSTWRREDVAAEVYVTIQQFDVDSSGRGVLVAWWRILSPGGEKTVQAGESRYSRRGPAPDANPSGAVATLSDLLADLSRQLAPILKPTTP